MSRVVWITGALLGIAATYVALTLPPRAAALTPPLPATVVLGGYHIHSNRSDGSGSVDEIANAASRAHLSFIILTDHGDATRTPDPPAYRHGVLVIDAVEINTAGGHVVALGLSSASPYPLAGAAADVIDDIHRLGGWAVVAHPDSPKPELKWRAWESDYDAVEWLNADSEWRGEPPSRWPGLIARLFVRPAATVASLFSRPAGTLRRWDSAARTGRVVGLAGLDAHARLVGWPDSADAASQHGRFVLAKPTYEDMFRTLAQGVILERPLGQDAAASASEILDAIRAGRTFSIVRGFATPANLEFEAHVGSTTVPMGASIDPPTEAIAFHADVPQAPAATLSLLDDGRVIAKGQGHVDYTGHASTGVYRVEVQYPGFAMPWIVSNPIDVGEPTTNRRGRSVDDVLAAMRPPLHLLPIGGTSDWHIERAPSSSGALRTDGGESRLDYTLGGGVASGQYAAMVATVANATGVDRIQFTIRADRPMRLSVQVRLPGGPDGQRWRHEVFVDREPRTLTIPLQTFVPADRDTSLRPIASNVRALLFVVDTLNTRPGIQGTVWLSKVALGQAAPDDR